MPGGRGSTGWGAVLSAGVMILFLVAIGNAQQIGWLHPLIVAAMPVATVLLGGFIWWELRVPRASAGPETLSRTRCLPWESRRRPPRFWAYILLFFLMPFYLQGVLGYSPGAAGLLMVPFPLVMIIVGPISGRLSDRYGTRAFKVAGMCLTAAGLLLFSRLTETSSLALLMPGMIAIGLGLGLFGSPNVSSILSTVAPSRYGVVSGLLAMFRNAFSVVGIVMAATIVARAMAAEGYPASLDAVSDTADLELLRAFASGMRLDFLIMGCLLLAGAAMSAVKAGERRWEPGR